MHTPETLKASYANRWPNSIEIRPWHQLSALHAGLGTVAVLFPENLEQLENMLATCSKDSVAVFPIGGGTNLIGQDIPSNFFALSMSKCSEARSFTHLGNGLFSCGAGLIFASLLSQLAKDGWGGAAPLSGIPGTLGGALTMNAGANGLETSHFVKALHGYYLNTGLSWHWHAGDGGWAYRTSPIQSNLLVCTADLQFCPVKVEEETAAIAAGKVRRACVTPKGASCGSVFRNPPNYAAGALLEQCGCKGMICGAFQVSQQHANWIVNLDRKPGAASDCLCLAHDMASRVKAQTGLELQFEIRQSPTNIH